MIYVSEEIKKFINILIITTPLLKFYLQGIKTPYKPFGKNKFSKKYNHMDEKTF